MERGQRCTRQNTNNCRTKEEAECSNLIPPDLRRDKVTLMNDERTAAKALLKGTDRKTKPTSFTVNENSHCLALLK
ncbi:hypothetical protein MHYP_G00252730 [Metynnis hypsauchen]